MIIIKRIVVLKNIPGKNAKVVFDQTVDISTNLNPEEFKTHFLHSKRYKNKVVDLTYTEA